MNALKNVITWPTSIGRRPTSSVVSQFEEKEDNCAQRCIIVAKRRLARTSESAVTQTNANGAVVIALSVFRELKSIAKNWTERGCSPVAQDGLVCPVAEQRD